MFLTQLVIKFPNFAMAPVCFAILALFAVIFLSVKLASVDFWVICPVSEAILALAAATAAALTGVAADAAVSYALAAVSWAFKLAISIFNFC